MFIGRSSHTLDSKGRLIIPSRFMEVMRKKGEDTLVITNHEECLFVFARDDWERIQKKAANLPLFDPIAQAYLRYFVSGAEYCQIKNKRITIPHNLRKMAGIEKEVVLVGAIKRFEIWDIQKWNEIGFPKSAELFFQKKNKLNQYGL